MIDETPVTLVTRVRILRSRMGRLHFFTELRLGLVSYRGRAYRSLISILYLVGCYTCTFSMARLPA
jgi:hypothetical protein